MSNRSHSRTTGRVVIACAAVIATMGGLSPQASAGSDNTPSGSSSSSAPDATTAQTASSTPDDREVAEASVMAVRRDRAQVRAELAAASSARAAQFDKWALNHLAMEAADTEVNRTIMLAEKARRDVLSAQRRVREYATEAFMHPPAFESLAVLSINDADEMTWAHELLAITADDQTRVVEKLADAKIAAERKSIQADEALDAAQVQAAEAKTELEALEVSLRRQQELAAEVDDRLEGALSEVVALEAIDARAAAELEAAEKKLAEESKALVAGNASERDSEPAPPKASPATPPTTTPKPSGPPPAPPSNIVTWQDVTKVGGIWVHKSIAARVQSLLSAAAGAGISLGGGGFRDPSEQIRLRQAHCGPTQYDIYEKSASECTPPTARPGRSMHERGLAIDFKSSGKLITSQADPAFQWLAAHAGAYGFHNLPSEPWHWSTTGG